MPGIIGLISQRPPAECESLVESMLGTMRREPFYKSGNFFCTKQSVYAGWVAHQNSFASSQAFLNEDRDIAILLSGECFPDAALITELRLKGHCFNRRQGDWLPHLYEEQGRRFWESLNGSFAGLLIDQREGKAFLFNDRYGTERIYWHETSDAFYFASEAKALLRVLPELREFDWNGVADFLNFGCTLGSRTLFRGIQRLAEASLWSFEGLKRREGKYFLPETWEQQPALTTEEFTAEFQATFERILPRYFVSDLKPAISLTGGLDSRLIMACLPATSPKPISYTFSGADQDVLDARVAARVAEVCHLEHEVIRLGPDFLFDFPSLADETVYITDGTLGITGAHEIYLNRKARLLSPVRITGVFGGEIIRGVSFFKPTNLASRLLSDDVRASVPATSAEQIRTAKNPVSFAAFNEIPQRRFGPPAAARSQLIFRTPYLDNDFVALIYRAPSDIQKNPNFVQTAISRKNVGCALIPTDRGHLGNSGYLMRALRRAVAEVAFKLDYYYSEGLPGRAAVLGPAFCKCATRTGLAGLHKFVTYRNWFAHQLADYVQEGLTEAQGQQNRIWNSEVLRALAEEHRLGHDCDVPSINAVLTLSAVQRLLLTTKKFSPDVIADAVPSPLRSSDAGRADRLLY